MGHKMLLGTAFAAQWATHPTPAMPGYYPPIPVHIAPSELGSAAAPPLSIFPNATS